MGTFWDPVDGEGAFGRGQVECFRRPRGVGEDDEAVERDDDGDWCRSARDVCGGREGALSPSMMKHHRQPDRPSLPLSESKMAPWRIPLKSEPSWALLANSAEPARA